ncbi:MAG TPA: diaminopimelate epimerase [Spirochaetota bacterium]|nr:diaminopimelate epimerase [Spirochaetota bacterium]HPG52631.1 diaminopimelate epimerase [Spirochaetota bacterium]HPN12113.1 diaminopimelate epimerase [Spirochaetota bacterium]
MKFTKMQGTGNDYLIIDSRKRSVPNLKKLAVSISNRHYGVGSDGILILLNSKTADYRMRIFNPDGSEAEMCGNGIRSFAKYLYDNRIINKKQVDIETAAGIKKLVLNVTNKKVRSVVVNMGAPILQRERIPMIGKPGMVINEALRLDDGTTFDITSLSMGNPHLVVFVEDIDRFPVEKYGPLLENHPLFPNRTNVEFVKVISRKEVSQRTWERGTGETLSCGTGASAVTAACILNKITDRKILIHLRGGDLKTEWREDDNNIYLTGPAVEVFRGEWPE